MCAWRGSAIAINCLTKLIGRSRRAAKEGGVELRQGSEAVRRRLECRIPKKHPPATDRRLQLLQRPPAPRLRRVRDGWQIRPNSGQDSGSFGTEWVGDLAVDATVEVEEARGELCSISSRPESIARPSISRTARSHSAPLTGALVIRSTSRLVVRQTSVCLEPMKSGSLTSTINCSWWVDGELVDLGDATYDPDKLLPGDGKGMIPWASEHSAEDQGDLSPVGIGRRTPSSRSRGSPCFAATSITSPRNTPTTRNTSPTTTRRRTDWETLFSTPDYWNVFAGRRKHEFNVEEGQLFVMGDNSPESKDCRLWMMPGMSG